MSPRLQTSRVQDALTMALGWRELIGNLIHHSAQGRQYTSHEFQTLLRHHQIHISISGVGNCYDNAMMESFFATLKTECVTQPFSSRHEARMVIFEYIKVWYNRLRRHSALNDLSPEQYEQLTA